jgi:hypothetical protein
MYKTDLPGMKEMMRNKDPLEPHMYELIPNIDYNPVIDMMKITISVQMHQCRDKCKNSKCR